MATSIEMSVRTYMIMEKRNMTTRAEDPVPKRNRNYLVAAVAWRKEMKVNLQKQRHMYAIFTCRTGVDLAHTARTNTLIQ